MMPHEHQPLPRVVNVPGAVLMGLGSILGTGIFVSMGIAAGLAGSQVVLAVVLAGCVATFNGLSSAQLAASHPVSGGTYAYGYRYLGAPWGFTAGWMFLAAKSASAATAALGFAGYVLTPLGVTTTSARIGLGIAVVVGCTGVVAGGMRRSNRTNAVIVICTLVALVMFVVAGLPAARSNAPLRGLLEFDSGDTSGLLHATALMFVAYTGYGRIATLGEEVRDPARSIPRAIVVTLLISMALYGTVTYVAVGTLGAEGLAEAARSVAAPLEVAARAVGVPAVAWVVAVGAIAAMLGVLLNLLLGLSRVWLAMARQGDMPRALAQVSSTGSPWRAVLVTGVLIAAMVLVGRVELTWSFSAFTVLVYYALTNLAALRLPAVHRRYPRIIAGAGLVSCLGLAFWIKPGVWATGLGVIGVGLLWHLVARRNRRTKTA